jgi:hypothetical protein
MDRVLRGLESPEVLGTAVVLGLGLAIYGALTFRLARSCDNAKSDCDQVLGLVHRIPGLGGPGVASPYVGGPAIGSPYY